MEKQIQIPLRSDLLEALELLSQKGHKSLTNIVLELLEKAIELEEDYWDSKIADERVEQDHKRISHEDAWK